MVRGRQSSPIPAQASRVLVAVRRCARVTGKAGENGQNSGNRVSVLTLDKTVGSRVWRHTQGSSKRLALDPGWGSGQPGSGVAIDWVTSRSYSSARRRLNAQSGLREDYSAERSCPWSWALQRCLREADGSVSRVETSVKRVERWSPRGAPRNRAIEPMRSPKTISGLDNSRAQHPQRRMWISEQSPIRCRGTSSRHSMESIRRRRRIYESSFCRRWSQKFIILTVHENLESIVKKYYGIIEQQHFINQRQSGIAGRGARRAQNERRFGESFQDMLCTRCGIWEEDMLIAEIEELEKLGASETYPRRLNAKEVLITEKDGNFVFLVADGSAKLSGRDYEF